MSIQGMVEVFRARSAQYIEASKAYKCASAVEQRASLVGRAAGLELAAVYLDIALQDAANETANTQAAHSDAGTEQGDTDATASRKLRKGKRRQAVASVGDGGEGEGSDDVPAVQDDSE